MGRPELFPLILSLASYSLNPVNFLQRRYLKGNYNHLSQTIPVK